MRFGSLFTVLFLFHCFSSLAQKPVWEGVETQRKKVQNKKESSVEKIRNLKQQIQEWGLDTKYKHALALTGRLHTNGWSGGMLYQQPLGKGQRSLWQINFSEIKHEKEVQQQLSGHPYPEFGKPKPFILGKVNKLYTLQIGYGREQVIFPALLNGNMSLGLRYSGGLSLAFLKPYYLDLIYVNYTPEPIATLHTEKYSDQNRDKFLQQGSVLKAAPWSKGINETRLRPGLFAELATVIEPDKPQTLIKTITIGAQAAVYTNQLQIMALQKAYPYQLSCFVGLALGKRW